MSIFKKKKLSIGELKREYDTTFVPDQEYLDSMPDLQNGKFIGKPIEWVGITNFKMPVKIAQKDGGSQIVTASISGNVSLEADKAGINMSRLIRTAYKSKDDTFSIDELEKVLRNYKKDLNSFDAHILMNFEYSLWQDALRSKKDDGTPEGGWQFYNITFDVNLDKNDEFKKIMWVDFVYSSACPCSTALSIHAGETRGVYGIPHSQRSVARIGVEFKDFIWIEDIIDMCREQLQTETLVFCKRQDEQAFAEKNGANVKFVEDAIRLIATGLNNMPKVIDFKAVVLHAESLHSHSAVASITKGVPGSIFNHHVGVEFYRDMAHSIA